MAVDYTYTDDAMISGLAGFSVTNYDGTCLYDDFYSNLTMSENGEDVLTMTGP